MSCLVAFHYRSYGTFFLHKNRLHNIYRGFTHYKYYRALIIPKENGEQPSKELSGYELVKTEKDANGNVRHVYRKIQKQTPVEPSQPVSPQEPATPAQPVQPTAVKEAEGKRELPNTGTEANASLAALGLLGALSGFGLLARKKKED